MLLDVNVNVNVALVSANIVNNMEMPGHDIQNSLGFLPEQNKTKVKPTEMIKRNFYKESGSQLSEGELGVNTSQHGL